MHNHCQGDSPFREEFAAKDREIETLKLANEALAASNATLRVELAEKERPHNQVEELLRLNREMIRDFSRKELISDEKLEALNEGFVSAFEKLNGRLEDFHDKVSHLEDTLVSLDEKLDKWGLEIVGSLPLQAGRDVWVLPLDAKPSLVDPQVKVGHVYAHFRGQHYLVTDLAYDEASLKGMVVYEVYPKSPNTACWVRPIEEFCMKIDGPRGKVSRYRLIGKCPDIYGRYNG